VTAVVFRPAAKHDQRHEVRYYPSHGSEDTALRLVDSLAHAIAQLQFHPGIGSPMLGRELGIDNLSTWRVRSFPLLYVYVQRSETIDIVRLLGERQDIAAILSELG
jgi:toxin ParE1/3/4